LRLFRPPDNVGLFIFCRRLSDAPRLNGSAVSYFFFDFDFFFETTFLAFFLAMVGSPSLRVVSYPEKLFFRIR
jgi:hypothetical protein